MAPCLPLASERVSLVICHCGLFSLGQLTSEKHLPGQPGVNRELVSFSKQRLYHWACQRWVLSVAPANAQICPWSISLLSFCKMQLFRGALLVSSQSFIGFDLHMLLFLHIFPLVNCLAQLLSPVLTATQLKAVSNVYAIAWRLGCPENSLLDLFSLPPLRHGQNIDKFFAMIRHKWPHVQFQESPHFYSEEAWWVISTTKFWLPTRIKLSL